MACDLLTIPMSIVASESAFNAGGCLDWRLHDEAIKKKKVTNDGGEEVTNDGRRRITRRGCKIRNIIVFKNQNCKNIIVVNCNLYNARKLS